MLKPARSLFLLICLLTAPLLHAAEETIESVQNEIQTFAASPDYQYAPATVARAQAFLGAAILANEQQNNEEIAAALAAARSTLQEARGNAARFKQQHALLIELRASAENTIAYVQIENPLAENNPKQVFKKAEFDFATAIKAAEAGELNNSQQAAAGAEQGYRRAVELSLPQLIDLTGKTISKAAASGAKKYAPATYGKALDAVARMQRYVDGVSSTMPTDPGHGLALARSARDIALQVKTWRKDSGSHEELLLKSRADRLLMAEKLGIAVDNHDVHADVSIEKIAARLDAVMAETKTIKANAQTRSAQMQADFDARLEAALAEQREQLLNEREAQLGNLKEAFRAKLEQETFETKRRKKITGLFKKGEVEILANLDGSILMRLSALKFAPGSSKIDPNSFDLLGRVKSALEVYGERKVRIEGHTDNQGDVKLNQRLSLKRAEAVRDFLIAASLEGNRLKALGYGEVRPIASNEFEKGRAMNRRIDLVIEAK